MSADGNSSICIQEQVHPHSTVNLMSRPREQNDYYYCPTVTSSSVSSKWQFNISDHFVPGHVNLQFIYLLDNSLTN